MHENVVDDRCILAKDSTLLRLFDEFKIYLCKKFLASPLIVHRVDFSHGCFYCSGGDCRGRLAEVPWLASENQTSGQSRTLCTWAFVIETSLVRLVYRPL